MQVQLEHLPTMMLGQTAFVVNKLCMRKRRRVILLTRPND